MLCRGAIDPAFVGMIRKPSSLTESGSFEGVFSVNTEELQGITLFRREATYQMTFPILANLLTIPKACQIVSKIIILPRQVSFATEGEGRCRGVGRLPVSGRGRWAACACGMRVLTFWVYVRAEFRLSC